MNYLDLSPDRTSHHNNDRSQRILSRDHDKVGLAGEFVFGEFSGRWPDTSIKRGGDEGIDFHINLTFTVDVRTARKPYNLIHEEGKPFSSDIYVLAGFNDDTQRASLIGWEWGSALSRAPTRDFGHGVINHFISADKLRPMEELAKRLSKI
jgi:hypothetical protein